MAVVTGKGLSDLIREEFGFRPTFFVMVAGFLVDMGNVVAEFAAWPRPWNFRRQQIYRRSHRRRFSSGCWFAGHLSPGGENISGACAVLSHLCFFRGSGQAGLARGGASTVIPNVHFDVRLSADVDGADRAPPSPLGSFFTCRRDSSKSASGPPVSPGAHGRDRRQRQLHGDRIFHHRVHGGDAVRFRAPRHHRRSGTPPRPWFRWPGSGPAYCLPSACSTLRCSLPPSCRSRRPM